LCWQIFLGLARSECLHRAVAEAAGLSVLDAAAALVEKGGEATGLNA